jgi:hypothetical protein
MASKQNNQKALDTLVTNWRKSVGGDAAAILAASKFAPKVENQGKPRSYGQAMFLRNLLRLNRVTDVPETATLLDCWRAISLAQFACEKAGRKALGRTSPERRVLATYLGVQLEKIDQAAESRKSSRAETVAHGPSGEEINARINAAVEERVAALIGPAVEQAVNATLARIGYTPSHANGTPVAVN